MTASVRDPGSPGDRLDAVRRLQSTALGSRSLQRLTGLAVRLLGADAAWISLFGDVETVVSGDGLPSGSLGRQVPLEDSLCAAALADGGRPLVVEDAVGDPRVSALPPVADGRVAGYVGVPLVVFDGSAVGALAVGTRAPRAWSDSDVALLRQLADSAATELELSALAREFEAHRLRFEMAIDAAEIGSFDWDLSTGRLVWDDRMVEIFGYDRDSFLESVDSFTARLHADDRERTLEAIQAAIEERGEFDAEFRIVLPAGEVRWVQGRGRVVADDDGAPVRFLGAAFDTTRQQGEEARVARVLEAMNAAFFALDLQWRFDYVNAEAERLLLRSREELLGGSIWELFPEAVGSDFETHYRGAAATGEEQVFEAYYPAPLDSWYEVRAWPSPDGLSVYFLDVTERKAAEERARRGAERLAVIAATAAQVSDALAEAAGEEEAVRRLARAVVPILGDWAIASLVGEDGRLVDVASWHVDPELRETAERYARLRLGALRSTAPIVAALRSGQPMIVDDVPAAVGRTLPTGEVRQAFDALAPRTGVALPLMARGRTVGALSIYRSRRTPRGRRRRRRHHAAGGRPRRAGAGQLPAQRAAAAPRRGTAAQPADRTAGTRPRRDRGALPAGRARRRGGRGLVRRVPPVVGRHGGGDRRRRRARHRGRGRDGPAARHAARDRLPRRRRSGRRPHRAGRRDPGPRDGDDGHRGDRPVGADGRGEARRHHPGALVERRAPAPAADPRGRADRAAVHGPAGADAGGRSGEPRAASRSSVSAAARRSSCTPTAWSRAATCHWTTGSSG